ncbi:hypothetical protein GCM10027175_24370 [Hymenobacter latericoloratus]
MYRSAGATPLLSSRQGLWEAAGGRKPNCRSFKGKTELVLLPLAGGLNQGLGSRHGTLVKQIQARTLQLNILHKGKRLLGITGRYKLGQKYGSGRKLFLVQSGTKSYFGI